jgi:hypothetical protein
MFTVVGAGQIVRMDAFHVDAGNKERFDREYRLGKIDDPPQIEKVQAGEG